MINNIILKLAFIALVAVSVVFVTKYMIQQARESEAKIQQAKCESLISKNVNEAMMEMRIKNEENNKMQKEIYSSSPVDIITIIDIMRKHEM